MGCILLRLFGPKPTDYLAWMTAYDELLRSLVSPLPETAMTFTLPRGYRTIAGGRTHSLLALVTWTTHPFRDGAPLGGVRGGVLMIMHAIVIRP